MCTITIIRYPCQHGHMTILKCHQFHYPKATCKIVGWKDLDLIEYELKKHGSVYKEQLQCTGFKAIRYVDASRKSCKANGLCSKSPDPWVRFFDNDGREVMAVDDRGISVHYEQEHQENQGHREHQEHQGHQVHKEPKLLKWHEETQSGSGQTLKLGWK